MLAGDPKFAVFKNDLSRRMREYLERTGDPRMRGESPWDTYPFVDDAIFDYPLWERRGRAERIPKDRVPK